MAADLAPLAPVNPSPLVRQKRHYHGEHQQGSKQNKKQSEADEKTENSETELKQEQSPENGSAESPKSLNNSVNQDEKHATVRHLDEYV